jgi:hypothetical protein
MCGSQEKGYRRCSSWNKYSIRDLWENENDFGGTNLVLCVQMGNTTICYILPIVLFILIKVGTREITLTLIEMVLEIMLIDLTYKNKL